MKKSQMIVGALVTFFSMSAFAQSTVKTEAERDRANMSVHKSYPTMKFESTKTRSEVVAELEAARKGVPAATSPMSSNADDGQTKRRGYTFSLYNGA